jgi:hypothetical protein
MLCSGVKRAVLKTCPPSKGSTVFKLKMLKPRIPMLEQRFPMVRTRAR